MPIDYGWIESHVGRVEELNKAQFLKERDLYRRAAELIVEPFEALAEAQLSRTGGTEDSRTAQLLAITRMFNDFEAAKNLILLGYGDQAYMPMRDSVECMMMSRLFRRSPKRASRWLIGMKNLSPDQVNQWLIEEGEDAFEYNFYATLSQHAHANLIGCFRAVKEEKAPKGFLRRFTLGAVQDDDFSSLLFAELLSLMAIALLAVLPPTYEPVMNDIAPWRRSRRALISDLHYMRTIFEQQPDKNSSEEHRDSLSRWQEKVILDKLGLQRLERAVAELEGRSRDDTEVR